MLSLLLLYYNHCYHHLEPQIYDVQHGFMRGKSTTTQLLDVYHDVLDSVASGKQVDAIYLDLLKAFDKVPHHHLLSKLCDFGIRGTLLLVSKLLVRQATKSSPRRCVF